MTQPAKARAPSDERCSRGLNTEPSEAECWVRDNHGGVQPSTSALSGIESGLAPSPRAELRRT